MTKRIKTINSEPPPQLLEVIQVMNLVPLNVELPDYFEVLKTFGLISRGTEAGDFEGIVFDPKHEKYSKEDVRKFMSRQRQVNEEIFSKTPPDFRDYIEQTALDQAITFQRIAMLQVDDEELSWDVVMKIGSEFIRFTQTREDLRKIAIYFEALRNTDAPPSHATFIYSLRKGIPIELPKFESTVRISSSNRIEVVPEGIAELVNNIDGTRLRICQICSKFFWAKRSDAETCSKPCLNAYQQRKFYQRNKEQLKEARRIRYQHAKRQKQIKEMKNNGTL